MSIAEVRINERIYASHVRLVAQDGEQIGVKTRDEALRIVADLDLDLVEVAPDADPPVCRIMDYGKFRYEMEQKAKKARKHQTNVVIKEIKFRPKIDPHDYATKKNHVVRFLSAGSKVKVTIMFRGREMAHTDLGKVILDRLAGDLDGLGVVEAPAKLDGRNMIMMVSPTASIIAARKAAHEKAREDAEHAKELRKANAHPNRLHHHDEDDEDGEDAEATTAVAEALQAAMAEMQAAGIDAGDIGDVDAEASDPSGAAGSIEAAEADDEVAPIAKAPVKKAVKAKPAAKATAEPAATKTAVAKTAVAEAEPADDAAPADEETTPSEPKKAVRKKPAVKKGA